MQSIKLETLKQWERDEYEALTVLRQGEGEALKANNMEEYESIHSSAQYQLGRWGVLNELIEVLTKNN